MKSRYSITELCNALGVSKTFVYYQKKDKKPDTIRENAVIQLFNENRKVYGVDKLHKAMIRKGYTISRRKISEIMKKYDLVSRYVKYRKKQTQNPTNRDDVPNSLKRKFYDKQPLEVMVSDLTYVDVQKKWHYICLLVELSHREIVGFAAGAKKDASLVEAAIHSARIDWRQVEWFHTDRGGEFKNEEIERILTAFDIKRSLSKAGTPLDNAVAESMYDILKVEFAYGEEFKDLTDLQLKLADWVWWYNNKRLHGSLGFKTPVESRLSTEIGVTQPSRPRHRSKVTSISTAVETQNQADGGTDGTRENATV